MSHAEDRRKVVGYVQVDDVFMLDSARIYIPFIYSRPSAVGGLRQDQVSPFLIRNLNRDFPDSPFETGFYEHHGMGTYSGFVATKEFAAAERIFDVLNSSRNFQHVSDSHIKGEPTWVYNPYYQDTTHALRQWARLAWRLQHPYTLPLPVLPLVFARNGLDFSARICVYIDHQPVLPTLEDLKIALWWHNHVKEIVELSLRVGSPGGNTGIAMIALRQTSLRPETKIYCQSEEDARRLVENHSALGPGGTRFTLSLDTREILNGYNFRDLVMQQAMIWNERIAAESSS